jgi:hypothetical protein
MRFPSTLRAFASSLFLLAAARAADNFTPLFNGRDLAGWVNVNCAPETWAATNGLIYCTGAPIGELRTERMYQNFVLELEWRHLKPKGNAGVFVWADALTARGQPFIRGVEVQVLDGQEGPGHTSDGDIFPIHGAKMTPFNGRGGDRAFPTEKRMKPSPEWNHYRIECVDGAISLAVNGKVVTRGTNATPRKGYICLESEGSPAEFRNLRIMELPATVALAPEHIANPDEQFRPLYTGTDLRGWNVPPAAPLAWNADDWTLTSPGNAASPLVSRDAFGDGEFIFDWRWSDAKQPGDWTKLIRLRRQDLSAVLATPAAKSAELKPGQWNRARFTLRGNSLTVAVNGQPVVSGVTVEGLPPRGAIELAPSPVPAQLASLYWRTLD